MSFLKLSTCRLWLACLESVDFSVRLVFWKFRQVLTRAIHDVRRSRGHRPCLPFVPILGRELQARLRNSHVCASIAVSSLHGMPLAAIWASGCRAGAGVWGLPWAPARHGRTGECLCDGLAGSDPRLAPLRHRLGMPGGSALGKFTSCRAAEREQQARSPR